MMTEMTDSPSYSRNAAYKEKNATKIVGRKTANLEAESITVAISELTPRADSDQNLVKSAAVNVELGRLCARGTTPLIKHSNIDATKHLNGSKLHLNKYGTSLLAGNYVKFLRN